MKRLAGLLCVLAATMLTAACTTSPTAVRGIQSDPGGRPWSVAFEHRGASESGVPASGTYMGASADGSYIGFIYPDGTIRWWHR